MTEQFRWRFNPNVIAQYVLDRHVPVGATTVLKPNEACLVIEDGRIIGTSTQTDLVVNPEVGALGRIFGKGPAKRAFLFVLLGPHDLHFTIKGRTKDGMEVRALVGLRVEFTIQQLGRLLNLPAKGTTTLLTGALAERLQPQMTPIVVNEVMARSTLDELRSDATAASNARASIRASMRSSLEALALQFDDVWISWDETEQERLLKMQEDLDSLTRRNAIMDATAQEEMETMIRARSRELQLRTELRRVEARSEAQSAMSAEVARMEAEADADRVRWEALAGRTTAEQRHAHDLAESDRAEALAAAAHAVELARLEAEAATVRADARLAEARSSQDLEMEAKRAKADLAMDMFAQVQAAKREREAQRLDHLRGSKQDEMHMVERLLEKGMASGATDASVLKELLRSNAEAKVHEATMTRSALDADPEDEGPTVED